MTWRAGIAGLALGAVTIAAPSAEPAGAPLADSKRELKAFEADQATKANPSGKTTGNLPEVGAPTPGETPLDLTASIRAEKELRKKKDAQKNWLLDGMDKLGPSAKRGGKNSHDLKEVDAVDPADSSDPNYLLKLYSEQQSKDEARTEAKTASAARNNPFAPFLQGWLANSPANVKSFDATGRKPEAIGMGASGPAQAEVNMSQVAGAAPDLSGLRGNSAPPVAQSNPYLEAPAGPALPDFGTVSGPGSPAKGDNGPGAAPPKPSMVEPIPTARPVEKKPQFLRPSDNDKYFPQQRKF